MDLNSLSIDELIGSLLTYEMKINHNDEGSSNNNDEEEMVIFAKKFKKFMKFNKAKRFPIRDIIKGEPSKKEKDQIICYK
ncbi:UBN2 domain-containing protein [Gossypium australe]|uniref:UBN2 domain-containing protein n=1 Tax=Gossypium australe TaxID=47621 RepID=A0A5B6VPD7_9ROSI|nr:UBN2 domain-containing protein [Gossypium australe]